MKKIDFIPGSLCLGKNRISDETFKYPHCFKLFKKKYLDAKSKDHGITMYYLIQYRPAWLLDYRSMEQVFLLDVNSVPENFKKYIILDENIELDPEEGIIAVI